MSVKGYVAVLVRPDGRGFASAVTFDGSTYSGFDLQETQRLRVRDALATAAIQQAMASEFAEVISLHGAKDIIGSLCHRKKWNVIEIPLGHDE